MVKVPARQVGAALLISSTALTMSQPALAQSRQAGGSDDDIIPQIIVTAERGAAALKDVPMAVDVATGEQLKNYNILDLKDVASLAPGLQISSEGRSNIATLRGISFEPDIGGPAAVAVYYNEIPVDIQTAATALYDIKQIEVLRGPQGTLRGRTAPAGAITVTTATADLHEIDGYAQGTFTTLAGRNLQGAASVPLVEDALAIRVAGLLDRNRGNQVRNLTNGRRSRQSIESGRAAIAAAPAENVAMNLTYQYLDNEMRESIAVMGAGNRPSLLSPFVNGPSLRAKDRKGVSEGLGYLRNRTHILTFDADWTLGNHVVSVLAGYQRGRYFSQYDTDIGNAVADYAQYLDVANRSRDITGEARLTSQFEGFFNYTLGVFYNKSTTDSASSLRTDSFFSLTAPPTPIPASQLRLPLLAAVDIENDSSDLAFFGSARFQVSDRLKLELGARLTRSRASAQSYLAVTTTGSPALGVPAGVILPRRATVDPDYVNMQNWPLTGTASVSYDFTPDMTGYASYGRSFRRGSAQLGVNSPLDSDLLVLDPERSNALELGFKANLFDRRVKVNLAAFYQKFDGFIGLTSVVTAPNRDGVISGAPANLSFNGDAISKGVEAQIEARITRAWNVGLSASYARSRYDNARTPCNDYNFDGKPDTQGTRAVPIGQQVSFCTRNDRISETPDFSLSANTEYAIDLGDIEPFIRGLVTYRTGFYSQLASYRYNAYSNANLYVGIRNRTTGWDLTLFVKNLFDTTQVRSVSNDGNLQVATGTTTRTGTPTPFLSNYRAVYSGLPREFGLTGRVAF
jgi:iron complex outermembrane receptor protein